MSVSTWLVDNHYVQWNALIGTQIPILLLENSVSLFRGYVYCIQWIIVASSTGTSTNSFFHPNMHWDVSYTGDITRHDQIQLHALPHFIAGYKITFAVIARRWRHSLRLDVPGFGMLKLVATASMINASFKMVSGSVTEAQEPAKDF